MGHKPMTLDVDLDIQKGRMQDVKLKVCYLKLNASCRTSPLRYIYTERKRFFSLSLLNVHIKLDFLWTHLEAMSLSLSRQYKRTLTITLLVGQLHLRSKIPTGLSAIMVHCTFGKIPLRVCYSNLTNLYHFKFQITALLFCSWQAQILMSSRQMFSAKHCGARDSGGMTSMTS